METSIIEQLDQSRYNLLKWITFGWGIWYATFILKDVINNPTIIHIAGLLVTEILLYFSVLAFLISSLIYNRN